MDGLNVSLQSMLENSYRNFHAKGFDYICLHRSPKLTMKLYMFNGDCRKLPEVVNPHDHRYDFSTHVLAGRVANLNFAESVEGEVYNQFEYLTPLNGGEGFSTFSKEVRLQKTSETEYLRDQSYNLSASDLHTISIRNNETVLLLTQKQSVLPLTQSTKTFIKDTNQPPSLEGLYDRWHTDDLLAVIRQLSEKRICSLKLQD
jgi:hypothetical protein